MTNRVFSPQFTVLIVVAWLVAGALLCRTRRGQLALGAVVVVAPRRTRLSTRPASGLAPHASAAFFAVALALTAALLVAAVRGAGPGDA